jgi:hypothetical protein
MTNKLDILQSLYNATISTTETYRITITDSKKIRFYFDVQGTMKSNK